MTDLSPAALSVMFAATNGNTNVAEDPVYKQCVAAAIRTAVNKTMKQKVMKTLGVTVAKSQKYCLVSDLLAIADELEGQND
jgi:hypothetical protein